MYTIACYTTILYRYESTGQNKSRERRMDALLIWCQIKMPLYEMIWDFIVKTKHCNSSIGSTTREAVYEDRIISQSSSSPVSPLSWSHDPRLVRVTADQSWCRGLLLLSRQAQALLPRADRML
ncbi:hypothetical protein CRUP_024586 [Coryphaenoides rupestris]|nr:hypothetical protein CRUP_024586 [Coryphaenoides rupestris]